MRDLSRDIQSLHIERGKPPPGHSRRMWIIAIGITAATRGGQGVTNAAVRGVSPESFLLRDMVKIVEGRNFTPGTDEVIVGRGIANRLAGVQVGRELPLKRN